MTFYDKNGKEISIGDHVVPDEGRELEITEERYLEELGETVLFGFQVIQPEFMSFLTQDNLSSQWTVVEESDDEESEETTTTEETSESKS